MFYVLYLGIGLIFLSWLVVLSANQMTGGKFEKPDLMDILLSILIVLLWPLLLLYLIMLGFVTGVTYVAYRLWRH